MALAGSIRVMHGARDIENCSRRYPSLLNSSILTYRSYASPAFLRVP
jgi:hypothetical protein